MFKKIKNYFNKKNLLDERYLYLFDKPTSDEYVCLDCETTGLDVKKDDIISIGAVIIKGDVILSSKRFVKFIKPKTKLQEEAIKIHHIRECDLQEAEDIDIVLDELLAFIGNKKIVGYFLEFDLAMINKYLKPKIGVILPNYTYEVSAIYHDWKIEKIPQSNIDLRFDTIMKELQIPIMGKHDAYNDAIMTAMMFIKLKNQPKVKIK